MVEPSQNIASRHLGQSLGAPTVLLRCMPSQASQFHIPAKGQLVPSCSSTISSCLSLKFSLRRDQAKIVLKIPLNDEVLIAEAESWTPEVKWINLSQTLNALCKIVTHWMGGKHGPASVQVSSILLVLSLVMAPENTCSLYLLCWSSLMLAVQVPVKSNWEDKYSVSRLDKRLQKKKKSVWARPLQTRLQREGWESLWVCRGTIINTSASRSWRGLLTFPFLTAQQSAWRYTIAEHVLRSLSWSMRQEDLFILVQSASFFWALFWGQRSVHWSSPVQSSGKSSDYREWLHQQLL